MSTINDGGPAFPRDGNVQAHCKHVHSQSGMTLRDWFAGMALQGYLAGRENPTREMIPGDKHHHAVAMACYRYADAMIAARDGKEIA